MQEPKDRAYWLSVLDGTTPIQFGFKSLEGAEAIFSWYKTQLKGGRKVRMTLRYVDHGYSVGAIRYMTLTLGEPTLLDVWNTFYQS